ncbi:hypothetical protein BN1050_02610 [Metalysinibacillus saudimassiliensis]|uniref:Uncharacterized protein n=1 Tax=Metalysinibacillus saudimassiliensis TaxID=1461583 RepID=A0A078MEG0_9BACL|nr:hypothetical protein BN1050_02610 [Metalysinibacillus saudimassiliensis]
MTLLGRVDVKFKRDDKDADLWAKLDAAAQSAKVPRTRIVKDALDFYFDNKNANSTGQIDGDQIAEMVEKLVEEKLAAKVSAVPVEKEENTKPQKKPGLMLGKQFKLK